MVVVRQPKDSYMCMVACAAMLTGESFEDVFNEVELTLAPDGSGKHYMTDSEMYRYLMSHGYSMGLIPTWAAQGGIKITDTKMDMEMQVPFATLAAEPALVGVKSDLYEGGEHSVVWDPQRGMILDPQHDHPRSVTRYVVLDWIPIWRLK